MGLPDMVEWRPRDTSRARELRNQATPQERMLWRYLSASQRGYKFSRQMPVGPYFCDFLCRRAKLVVELDGYSHNLSVEADKRRDRYLREQGFHVLRFTNAEVEENVEGVLSAIGAVLADRPTPGPSRKREGRE